MSGRCGTDWEPHMFCLGSCLSKICRAIKLAFPLTKLHSIQEMSLEPPCSSWKQGTVSPEFR